MNELQRVWKAWDNFSMRGKPLTQYISDYRDIVLKLPGIDDFQTVRGFLRGLDATYERDVQPRNPKILKEAICFDQIYDDTSKKEAPHSNT